MGKITPDQIHALSEQEANALLEKYSKVKLRMDKREEETRRIIGMLHARLNELAQKNGR